MNGINFSPQIWWNAMDRAVEFANHMGKYLMPDFNFKEWLQTGTIEHNCLEIHKVAQLDDILTDKYDYLKIMNISIEYFFKIGLEKIYMQVQLQI